jgi:GT2 family glycosyltransferase
VDPKVTAIVINYRTADFTVACIESLLLQRGVALEIIVVDNNSADGSLEKIRSSYGDSIKLIANDKNDGFAKANNLAAKSAQGEFIACVNPDIKITDHNALAHLVSYLENHPEVGLAGPQVIEPRKGRRVRPKFYYPEQSQLRRTEGLQDLPGELAWILGAFMIFPVKVYREIGGFDDAFFLYGEDTDICLRVRKAGYFIAHLEYIEVSHWSSASEEQSDSYDKWRRKKNGYYQFCAKHYDISDMQRILHKNARKLGISLKIAKLRQWLTKQGEQQEKVDRIHAELDVIKSYQI